MTGAAEQFPHFQSGLLEIAVEQKLYLSTNEHDSICTNHTHSYYYRTLSVILEAHPHLNSYEDGVKLINRMVCYHKGQHTE